KIPEIIELTMKYRDFISIICKSQEKIIKLRSQGNSNKLQRSKASLNESSKDVIINRQKLKIKALDEENSMLRTELQILYGKLAIYQT
ncbi:MAG: hypothetical protein JM58_17175, partial [Peptococcaceae bacterium BICA1-8]